MTIEDVIKLLGVLVSLVQALSWPLLLLFVLLYFGAPLRRFIENLGEFSLRAGAGGLEATVKRQIEAGVLLSAALAMKASDATIEAAPLPGPDKAKEIAAVVGQTLQPRVARQLARAAVLWVDENPADNAHEIRSMEALGMAFTLSPSVQDALEKVRLQPYDAIVCDMVQMGDQQAAYTLIDNLQQLGINTPVIVYDTTNDPVKKAEARRRGAFGSTGDPQDLFSMVTTAVRRR